MKNNFVLKFCVILFVFVLVSCTGQTNNNDEELNALKTQVAELQQQIQATSVIQPSIEVAIEVPTSIPPTNTPVPIPTEVGIDEIAFGQTIIIPDIVEFTINRAYFSKKIIPPTPGSFYTYYEAKEPGTTYLDIVVIYKNLQATIVDADELGRLKLIYREKYEYNSFPIIEEGNGSNFGYANITPVNPLQLGTVHYLVEVPDEVETTLDSRQIIITVNGEEYLLMLLP